MTDGAEINWPTTYMAIVPRLTGTLSAISSLTIIYLIVRSNNRLSTIYHRILFFMSVSDVISSIGMALTTIPMPTEMPQEKELGFYWPGNRYGNEGTCSAQGFAIMVAGFATLALNTKHNAMCL